MRSILIFIIYTLMSTQVTHAISVPFGNLEYDTDTQIIHHREPDVWRQYLGINVLFENNIKTYGETVAATSTGGLFEEYSIAKLSDVLMFVDSMFEGRATCTGDQTVSSELCGSGWVTGTFGGMSQSLFDAFWFENDHRDATEEAGLLGLNGDGFKRMSGDDGDVILYSNFGTFRDSDALTNDGLGQKEALRFTCDNISWLVYKDHEVGGDSDTVPEPTTIALLGIGLLGFRFFRRTV